MAPPSKEMLDAVVLLFAAAIAIFARASAACLTLEGIRSIEGITAA